MKSKMHMNKPPNGAEVKSLGAELFGKDRPQVYQVWHKSGWVLAGM